MRCLHSVLEMWKIEVQRCWRCFCCDGVRCALLVLQFLSNSAENSHFTSRHFQKRRARVGSRNLKFVSTLDYIKTVRRVWNRETELRDSCNYFNIKMWLLTLRSLSQYAKCEWSILRSLTCCGLARLSRCSNSGRTELSC